MKGYVIAWYYSRFSISRTDISGIMQQEVVSKSQLLFVQNIRTNRSMTNSKWP